MSRSFITKEPIIFIEPSIIVITKGDLADIYFIEADRGYFKNRSAVYQETLKFSSKSVLIFSLCRDYAMGNWRDDFAISDDTMFKTLNCDTVIEDWFVMTVVGRDFEAEGLYEEDTSGYLLIPVSNENNDRSMVFLAENGKVSKSIIDIKEKRGNHGSWRMIDMGDYTMTCIYDLIDENLRSHCNFAIRGTLEISDKMDTEVLWYRYKEYGHSSVTGEPDKRYYPRSSVFSAITCKDRKYLVTPLGMGIELEDKEMFNSDIILRLVYDRYDTLEREEIIYKK